MKQLEEFVNHSPAASGLQFLLVLYQHPAWFIVVYLDLRDVYATFVSVLLRIFPFFHNFAILLFLGNCNFYD